MSDYAFVHEGKAFTPNQTKLEASEVETHNANLEAQELAYWATQPESFTAYLVEHATKERIPGRGLECYHYQINTWLGTKLGDVFRSTVSRNNLGARIQYIRMRGTNGASYYGKLGSGWSQIIRLRKFK